jgi:hypothetical protein
MNEKKIYTAPVLTVHGDVEVITQQGGKPNADLPHGNANTAYSSI